MTKIEDIIKDAYRLLNLIPVGSTPTSAEVSEGLRYFNQEYLASLNTLRKKALLKRRIDDEVTVKPFVEDNTHLIVSRSAPIEVKLRKTPKEGARLTIQDAANSFSLAPFSVDSRDWPVEGVSGPITSSGFNKEFIFLSNQAEWKEVKAYASASDELIFPLEFDKYFTFLLALRLTQQHGEQLSDSNVALFQREERNFFKRYRQNRPTNTPLDKAFTKSFHFDELSGYTF